MIRAPVFGDIIGESPNEANNSMFSPNAHKPARFSTANWLYLLVLAVSFSMIATSCVTEDDLTADQRVHQLSQQLMCPVCDGQTLDQSQAQLPDDMKAVIRSKIEDGATNSEIRSYFVDRYGEIVLASPETEGFNLIAWIVPGLIFIAGALLVGNAYLNMRKRARVSGEADPKLNVKRSSTSPTGSDLDEYLQRADREMASALLGRSSNRKSDSGSEDKV